MGCDVSGEWFMNNNTNSIVVVTKITNDFYEIHTNVTKQWINGTFHISPRPYERPGYVAQFQILLVNHTIQTTNCLIVGECMIMTQWSDGRDQWCRSSNPQCELPPPFTPNSDVARFFSHGSVKLMEVSHSDIFWLGTKNDLLIDAEHIKLALELMRNDSTFQWQHECMLFWRVFIEIYPELEEELLQRVLDGRFDIGGTFTEGFESTMANEILVRQMYEGRKWFLDRYGHLLDNDQQTAVVAFHQDGPLRAIQMPQVYGKAGMKYLKASRLSDHIFRWQALDGKTALLAYEEVHYGQPLASSDDLLHRMKEWYPQFAKGHFPNVMHLSIGTDYYPPTLQTEFIESWLRSNETLGAFGSREAIPRIEYATFKSYLKLLDGVDAPILTGERPNLWYAETSPTDHWLFNDFRRAGKLLPAAESFAMIRCLLEKSWKSYPTQRMQMSWLNITLNDHGFGHENTPYSMPCEPGKTPLLCNLVNKDSPPYANLIYAEKFYRAREEAELMLREAQDYIASLVSDGSIDEEESHHAGVNQKIVVFNSLSWSRSDPVDVALPSWAALMCDSAFTVRDSTTRENVAFQRVNNKNKLVFIAEDVPSFGYKSFVVSIAHTTKKCVNRDPSKAPWTTTFTNQFYRITPGAGGIKSMVDIESGDVELFDTSEYMAGEWMTLAYTTNGASETRTYRHTGLHQGGSDSGVPTFNKSTMYFQRLGNMSEWTGWSCVENSTVRAVFQTNLVRVRDSQVQLNLIVYNTIKRVDFNVSLIDWDSAFGVTNRVVFPLNGASAKNPRQNVTLAVPFGVVRAGIDEIDNGTMDTWLEHPGPDVAKFDRGYSMRPREVQDWIHGEGIDLGVMLSTSVGLVDWIDATGAYGQGTVLAPELLWHTNSNQGPFRNESGDHYFSFSVFPTHDGGWRSAWRSAVQCNQPLTVSYPKTKTSHKAHELPTISVSSSSMTMHEIFG